MFTGIFERCPVILQHDEFDCAPACLASVCKYYGKRIPLTVIRRLAGTDRDGTSGFGIIRGAEELGFSCKGGASPAKTLSTDMMYPFIAHVKRDKSDHYVIVYKYKNNKVYIGDPACGLRIVKADAFRGEWTGVFFIILPIEKFEKNKVEKSIKVQTPNTPKVVVYAAGFTKPASNICLYIAGG